LGTLYNHCIDFVFKLVKIFIEVHVSCCHCQSHENNIILVMKTNFDEDSLSFV